MSTREIISHNLSINGANLELWYEYTNNSNRSKTCTGQRYLQIISHFYSLPIIIYFLTASSSTSYHLSPLILGLLCVQMLPSQEVSFFPTTTTSIIIACHAIDVLFHHSSYSLQYLNSYRFLKQSSSYSHHIHKLNTIQPIKTMILLFHLHSRCSVDLNWWTLGQNNHHHVVTV